MSQLPELEEEQQLREMISNLNIQIDNIEQESSAIVNEEPVNNPEQMMRLSPYTGEMIQICNHVFSRGPRQGQNCPDRICINSQSLCRTHHNAQERRNRRRVEREQARIIPVRPRQQHGRRRRPRRQRVPVPGFPDIPFLDLPPLEELLGNSEPRRRILFPVDDEKKEEFDTLIYKSCSMCQSKVEGGKVTLECGCEYHLNCFLLVQGEQDCLNCGDKINKTEEDYEDCSICLEKLKSGKVKTSCGHTFHTDCINSWIRIGRGDNTDKCPNCRGSIH